jgi:hypothetical protein
MVSNKFNAGAFDPHGVPATLSPRIHRRKERAKASRQVACACAYRYDHPELPFRSGARRQSSAGHRYPNGVCMEGAPTISLRDRKRDPSRRARTCQPGRIPRGQFACNARMKLLRRGTSRCSSTQLRATDEVILLLFETDTNSLPAVRVPLTVSSRRKR